MTKIESASTDYRADTATRLGRYFGTSAQYWLDIQNRFDLDSIDKDVIERDVIPKKAA